MEVLQLLTDIDLVIFDLGGVLYEIEFQRTVDALQALPGYDGTPVTFGLDEQDDIFVRVDRGEVSESAFYDALRARFGFTCSDTDIEAAWCAILIGPYADAAQLLDTVRAYRPLVLLSNISTPHLRHALPSMSDILDRVDAAFYSCEIGLRKPDPATFLHVTGTMGADPRRTLLVDDSPANCAAAKGLGMHVWHFTREA